MLSRPRFALIVKCHDHASRSSRMKSTATRSLRDNRFACREIHDVRVLGIEDDRIAQDKVTVIELAFRSRRRHFTDATLELDGEAGLLQQLSHFGDSIFV